MTGHKKASDEKIQHTQTRQQSRIWDHCDSCGARLRTHEEIVCERCLRQEQIDREQAERFERLLDAEDEWDDPFWQMEDE